MPPLETLAAQQRTFLNALLHADGANTASLAALVRDDGRHAVDRRVAAYTHAYRARLIEVLESDHEVLRRLLGPDRFGAAAGVYVDRHRSHDPSLRRFGDAFPAVVGEVTCDARAAALCAFERALLDAFDAEDAPTLSFATLQALPPAAWPALLLTPHTSARLFVDEAGAVPAWQALQTGAALPDATLTPVPWLLWRNAERVTAFRSLSPVEHALWAALGAAPLGTALEALLPFVDEADVPAAALGQLRALCEAGALLDLGTPPSAGAPGADG